MKIYTSLIWSATLFVVSALIFALSMPAFFNIPFSAFVALVPAILALRMYSTNKTRFLMFIFFGLLYALLSYSWYVDIFHSLWGFVLIVAVAFWHCGLIRRGIHFESRLPESVQIFSLPIVYSLLECAQRSIPFVKEWWFIPYPKTQWGFPESLQLLSITGITGLTFIMILSNSTIAKILQNIIERKKQSKLLFFNLALVASVLVFGFYSVHTSQDDTAKKVKIAVVSDMANELGGEHCEGVYVRDTVLSEKILERNIMLSKKDASTADFIVWSENEFFNFYDKRIQARLKDFAQELRAYLVVDSFKKDGEKLYDTAVLISPDKELAGFSEKRHLFSGEVSAGFVPSAHSPRAIKLENIRVGLGLCYDFHFSAVVRSLAKDGAELVLMPTDDDMNRNRLFPYYHASDAVFRAIENNVAFASANTNGASIVVNPSGKITVLSPVNKTGASLGTIYIDNKKTVYTKYGEWFVYVVCIMAMVLFLLVQKKKYRSRD